MGILESRCVAWNFGIRHHAIASVLAGPSTGQFRGSVHDRTVEEWTGYAPEDFETIARRYTAASPSAIRGPVGMMREVLGLAVASPGRTAPDIDKWRRGSPTVEDRKQAWAELVEEIADQSDATITARPRTSGAQVNRRVDRLTPACSGRECRQAPLAFNRDSEERA